MAYGPTVSFVIYTPQNIYNDILPTVEGLNFVSNIFCWIGVVHIGKEIHDYMLILAYYTKSQNVI